MHSSTLVIGLFYLSEISLEYSMLFQSELVHLQVVVLGFFFQIIMDMPL